MVRIYCAVYGCMSSSMNRPEYSFFKLPAGDDRREKWLQFASREDLKDRTPKHYTFCEEHFSEEDILPGPHRKKLKKTAVPTRNLPDFNRIKAQKQNTSEKCVQTEETYNNLAWSVSTQTHDSVPADGLPVKRKHENGSPECTKRNKLHERYERETFYQLCDRYLTTELSELVKGQIDLKLGTIDNMNHQSFIIFCLNLYYSCPKAYRLLQSPLSLPSSKTLNKRKTPVTSKINDKLMALLRTKVETMTQMEKNCSFVIGAINLRTNLYYDIKQDKIIGFREIDGVVIPEPAKHALVVMITGIVANWTQPVGFAVVSEWRIYDEIEWIDSLMEKLFEIGLNIRTFACDMESSLCDIVGKKSITVERPYFFFNNRKIYYICDAIHLLKLVRDTFFSYDFHFVNRLAKFEHVIQFYKRDKDKNFKQAPKLTLSHLYPNDLDKKKVQFVAQLLSNDVATGISTYVDFNILPETARDTAEFIKNMNDLFDVLNSSKVKDNNELKEAFCGKEYQITLLNKTLDFLEQLKVIDPKDGNDVTSRVKFIDGLKFTVKATLLLYEDLKWEGCKNLQTRKLQTQIETFFAQIKKINGIETEPTSRQFQSAFTKLFYKNIIKPVTPNQSPNNLRGVLIEMSALDEWTDTAVIAGRSGEEPADDVTIMSSDYNRLSLPNSKTMQIVSEYIFKKCVEVHNDCETFKTFGKPILENLSSENQYLHYYKFKRTDMPKFVRRMDDIFRYCIKKKRTIDCKIAEFIYKEMSNITLPLPCPCFPIVYVKKLFIRLKIYDTLKFNNKRYRNFPVTRNYFAVKLE